MLTGYLFRLLRDLLSTFRALKLPLNHHLQTTTGVDSIDDLSISGLVKMLQDDSDHSQLWTSLQNHPFIVHHGRRITELLCDPKKAASQIRGHQRRLQWHLDRLYRIRCCIVHGSPIRFRLALFAANLEYYLKQTLMFVLDAFRNHAHITDLVSLFQRSVVAWDRRLGILAEDSKGKNDIADAVFADVLIHS
jgi:hypothetical protein